MRPSAVQARALEWLVAYPGIRVGWQPGEYAHWTAYWRNEEARLHMIGVIADLNDVIGGAEVSRAAPRTLPRGGTPRLTTATFRVLVARGWVKVVAHRPSDGVMSEMDWWQISLDGVRAISPHLRFVPGDLAVSA